MHKILREDMEKICCSSFIDWDMLRTKTILITGATGLIGMNIVHALSYADEKMHLGLKIIAVVRDIQKAHELFSELYDIAYIVSSVEELKYSGGKIDYIIHGASPTASKYFVSHPVETIRTALSGTVNMLNIAKAQKVSGIIYLSSMEVYGHIEAERLLNEADLGYIDPLNPRNSYPESKRMCEAMCAAYAHEYGVPAKIVRLVMTFGPGIPYDDNRVCAEFMRKAIEEKDIILKTEGRTKRCYLYTADAVTAILTILLKGEAGHAYNAANPETYCSIREMAEMFADEISEGKISVRFSFDEDISMYPAPGFTKLDVSSLMSLGWRPSLNLKDMYLRTIDYICSYHAKI